MLNLIENEFKKITDVDNKEIYRVHEEDFDVSELVNSSLKALGWGEDINEFIIYLKKKSNNEYTEVFFEERFKDFIEYLNYDSKNGICVPFANYDMKGNIYMANGIVESSKSISVGNVDFYDDITLGIMIFKEDDEYIMNLAKFDARTDSFKLLNNYGDFKGFSIEFINRFVVSKMINMAQ